MIAMNMCFYTSKLVPFVRCNRILMNFEKSMHSKTFSMSGKELLKPCKQWSNLLIKRDMNFAKIRKVWRIIRLKDRGVEHNFMKDGVHKDNQLVYKAEYNRVVTYLGSICALALGAIAITRLTIRYIYGLKVTDPYDTTDIISRKYIDYTLLLLSCIYLTLCKRYVLRIYYNNSQKQFILSTVRWYWPLSTTTISCKPGDAVEVGSIVRSITGNSRIHKRKLYIYDSYFKFPLYFNVLFGYSDLDVINAVKDDSN